jgi:site-specific recombinase XerD
MKQAAKNGHSAKLEDNSIWKEANAIAEFMYDAMEELPRTEEWRTKSKIHMASNDLIFYVAQAIGNGSPGATEYDWGASRKHLFALKTMYRFACRQKYIDLDPEMMARIDKLLQQVSEEADKAYEKTRLQYKDELKPWLEKYKLWKEMQNES